MTENKGKIVIVSGPSGVGKSTVLHQVFDKLDRYFFSISATTRAPRPGETDGVEYYFISREEFEARIAQNRFLEYAEYAGNYYGTPIEPIYEHSAAGDVVFLDVEVQGYQQIREKIPEAVSVFIAPPSLEELESRLRGRLTETEERIEKRLSIAKRELALSDTYDHIVVNDTVENAAKRILAVIHTEE